jgi:hypothetical protein
LQSCSVKKISLRLKTLLNATTSKCLKNGLGALLTILLLDFKVAEELYADLVQIPLTCRQYDIHIRLKEDLLGDLIQYMVYDASTRRRRITVPTKFIDYLTI